MRKSKIEQVAEARRGVRAMVREGERSRMFLLCVVIVPRRWESVKPAQPVPMMAIVSFLLLLLLLLLEEEEEEEFGFELE
jgi:hypothetical protein